MFIVLVLLMFSINVNAASVSILSWWWNGSDGKLNYYINTKYSQDIIFASDQWNSYKPNVVVRVFVPSYANVIVNDFYEVSNRLGYASTNGTINLNTYLLDNASQSRRRYTTMHEMGHALGLAHNVSNLDVMYSPANDRYSLTINDKASYDASASRYGK